jgi:hypothetical protein
MHEIPVILSDLFPLFFRIVNALVFITKHYTKTMLSCAREDNWKYTSDANSQAADGDDRVPLPHGITWADATQHRKLCYSFRSINQILWRLNQSWHQKKAVVLEVFWSAMINRPCPKSTRSQLISRTVGMLEGAEGSLDGLLEAINEVFEDSTALGVELDIDEGSKFCIEGDGSSFGVKLRIVERSGYGIDDDLRLVAKLGIDKR